MEAIQRFEKQERICEFESEVKALLNNVWLFVYFLTIWQIEFIFFKNKFMELSLISFFGIISNKKHQI
jgi:hypothetical protein